MLTRRKKKGRKEERKDYKNKGKGKGKERITKVLNKCKLSIEKRKKESNKEIKY